MTWDVTSTSADRRGLLALLLDLLLVAGGEPDIAGVSWGAVMMDGPVERKLLKGWKEAVKERGGVLYYIKHDASALTSRPGAKKVR